MPRADRRLDLGQAAIHLSALDHPGIPHLLALIPEAPGALGTVRHVYGTLSEVADALDAAQRAGCGVHVTVQAMRGRRRLASEVERIRAVWCERDQLGTRLALVPSLRIRTSPGRGHEYLLTDRADPLTPAEAARITRQIAEQHGGDRQACDMARTLRLAGSWHLKRQPFRVEIIGGTGEAYGRGELLAVYPPPPPRPRNSLVRIDKADRYLARTLDNLLAELAHAPEGRRNGALNYAAFRLGQLGLKPDQVAAHLEPVAHAIGLGRIEVQRTIASGVAAGAKKVGGRAVA